MKLHALSIPILALLAACPTSTTTGTNITEGDAGTHSSDGGNTRRDGGQPDAGGGEADAGGLRCEPPDVLILLDRTGTMHRDLAGMTPPDTAEGHASAKLTQAINALDTLVAIPDLDQTLRLGLALFPMDPGGAQACITLTQRLQGQPFANPMCQDGQLVVPPALGTGALIGATLDPETTTICFTTPTGQGLITAMNHLAATRVAGREQYVMLVTDGADFYDSCPEPDPLAVLRQLEATGVKTFIVGFGAQDTTVQGVNPPILNRMACAGHTAKNFDTACTAADGGFDAVNPEGDRLYDDAANASELAAGLRSIAAELCCECNIGG